MKAASAPRRNAGAAACEITCDSWLTDGVSGYIGSVLRDISKKGRPMGDEAAGAGAYFVTMWRVGVTALVGAIGKIANVSQIFHLDGRFEASNLP
jgi:hypothetical protein